MKISLIIPTYNEEKTIGNCLASLSGQTIPFELIVVDDGSTDSSKLKVESLKVQQKIKNLIYLEQRHLGPAAARNKGAKIATGDILVFVDSDMTFAPDFLQKLVAPIEKKETKGTFTKAECVSNWDNVWARCWNYNLNLPDKHRLPANYPASAPVFRAILKSEFMRVGGFTEGIGWTDDWTLSQKLGYNSSVTNAICYHSNPDTLIDVFRHAQWIGKNEFIAGSITRVLFNLFRHSCFVSIIAGFWLMLRYQTPAALLLKLVYDAGITFGIHKSLGGDKNK